jgi:cytochrome P450
MTDVHYSPSPARQGSLTRPPGPRGHVLLGILPDLMADPLATLQSAARYGDIVGLPALGKTIFFLNHPDYLRHVLVDNARNYSKGPALKATRRLTGSGLLASEGEAHTHQRRFASPAFHRQAVAGYGEIMVALAEGAMDAWQAGQRRDIHNDMMALTLEVVASCLFGADLSAEAGQLARALGNFIDDFSPLDITRLGPWLEKLPTPRQRRRNRNVAILEETITRIISSGQAHTGARGGLLPLLLEALRAGKEGVTEQQVRDEVMTLFLAGQETTGPALTWTFYLLSRHPEAEEQLHAEVERVLGGRPPSADDFPDLQYTRMVFSEALRLYPPAWGLGRRALAPDEIGGYPIPNGATVLMSQYVMHRNPVYWDAPDEFRPDRFLPGAQANRRPYTYIPFGAGPRMCLGEQFAWMEGVLLTAAIARRFRLRLAPEARIEPVARMSIRLKHGLPMIVEQRR